MNSLIGLYPSLPSPQLLGCSSSLFCRSCSMLKAWTREQDQKKTKLNDISHGNALWFPCISSQNFSIASNKFIHSSNDVLFVIVCGICRSVDKKRISKWHDWPKKHSNVAQFFPELEWKALQYTEFSKIPWVLVFQVDSKSNTRYRKF